MVALLFKGRATDMLLDQGLKVNSLETVHKKPGNGTSKDYS